MAETLAVKLAEKQGNLALPKLYIAIKAFLLFVECAHIAKTEKNKASKTAWSPVHALYGYFDHSDGIKM